jgi:hypothetical protein
VKQDNKRITGGERRVLLEWRRIRERRRVLDEKSGCFAAFPYAEGCMFTEASARSPVNIDNRLVLSSNERASGSLSLLEDQFLLLSDYLQLLEA